MIQHYLKKACFVAVGLAFVQVATAQQNPLGGFAYGEKQAPTGKEWESVEELSLNKEYPKAYFFSFSDKNSAQKVLPENAKYWQSLNGNWKFHWVKHPDERPKDFYKSDFNTEKWDNISVPSSWNIVGVQKDGSLKYGVPIYVNQPVIFYHERKVDDWRKGVMRTPPTTWTTYIYRNEVGSYRRDFEVPADWNGREIFIDFDGVDSFFYLWINGKYVGFSKNSRNQASFNISKYLQKGKNSVAVEVYRNSDGSFLEAQDMFRLPGIYRTVALRSVPKVHIRNLNILGDLDKNYENGVLKVSAEIRNLDKKSQKNLSVRYSLYEVELYSDKTAQITDFSAEKSISEVKNNQILKISSEISVKNPKKWSAEKPNRYVLVAELLDRKGKVVETVSSYFGFRKVEILDTPAEKDEFGKAGRYFFVNGKTIKFKGVNRHETHPAQGHFLTREQMEEEVKLMLRANINHTRNSHYPTDPYWYYLCDKYGIYLEDEANIESHQYYYGKESLSHPKEWEKAHTARVVEMVEATYNHPSIVIWSLGNEAGPGQNFVTAYNELKKLDTSRPVQYERNNDIVDMGSNQYPSVAWVQGASEGKYSIKYPFHISEYAHSMGNAVGNLADYWEAIESSNFICGGAIWDWVDQAMYHYTKDGKRYLAYGGDFGDFPNDGQFVMNGIIFADRTPKPQYYEVKKVYQNIGVRLVDENGNDYNSTSEGGFKIEIFNKNYFTDLSDYEVIATIYKDGKKDESMWFGSDFNVQPRTKKIFENPFRLSSKLTPLSVYNASEYFIKIQFKLKEDKPWAKKGFVQAEEQFLLSSVKNKKTISEIAKGGKLLVEKLSGKEILKISNENLSIQFNNEGTISQLKYDDKKIIENGNGPKLNAFRAFVNNDVWAYQQWFEKGLHNLKHKLLNHKYILNKDGSVSVYMTTESQAPNAAKIHGGTSSGRNKIEELTQQKFGENDFKFITHQIYTIYPDGSVDFQAAVSSNDSSVTLPQLGFLMKLPKENDNFSYYGRGKHDNYPDRKTGAFIELHSGKVADEMAAFPKPQDMGHHQDTRWASLVDSQGVGAVFIPNNPASVCALPYSALQMLLAPHIHELPQSDGVYLQLNIGNTGLGGNSCGPTPLVRDRVMATPHNFGFLIRPVKNNAEEMVGVVGGQYKPLSISRNNIGKVTISADSSFDEILYSINNGKPQRYTLPFDFLSGGTIKAWFSANKAQPYEATFNRIEIVPMEVVFASSEEAGVGDAKNLLDGNPNTIWHTTYGVTVAKHPHWVDFDMGKSAKIKGFTFTQRSDSGNGKVKDYQIHISNDGKNWSELKKGQLTAESRPQRILFDSSVTTRFVRFTALSEHYGQDYASGGEFSVIAE